MEKKRHPFRLSKVNWIFAIIVVFLYSAYFLASDGINAYSIGSVFGTVIIYAVVLLVFAVLAWLIQGRKMFAGTHTFNVVLGMLSIGMILEVSEMSQERTDGVEGMVESAKAYKEKVLNDEDSTDHFLEYTNEVDENLSKLIGNSLGNEQKVYLGLKDFLSINKEVMVDWQNSYDSVMEPRILDYSVLDTPREFQYQLEVLKKYLDESNRLKSHMINRRIHLGEILKDIPPNNRTYMGVIRGFNAKDSVQMPMFIPYIDSHLSYGENLTAMLKFLNESREKWEFNDEGLFFQGEDLEHEYSEIIGEIAEDESNINTWYEKFLDVM